MGRDDGSQFWHFLRRAAIIRQFEGLEAINALIAANTGNFGVLLLRPAFEELAWIEYLTKHPDIASDLLLRMTQHEVATSLAAQFKYAGEEQMREGGFTPRIFAQWLFSGAVARGVIRKIGAPLDWKTGRKIRPSMSYIAKQVGARTNTNFFITEHLATYISQHRNWDDVFGAERERFASARKHSVDIGFISPCRGARACF